MKKILHIILITIISLTVISCSSSDDSKTTTSSVSFVAVGTSGTLLTSSDGTSWTSKDFRHIKRSSESYLRKQYIRDGG